MPIIDAEEYEEMQGQSEYDKQFGEVNKAEDKLFKEDNDHILIQHTYDADKYSLYDTGIEAGLSEEAAYMFRGFECIDIEMKVNKKTGRVVAARVIN